MRRCALVRKKTLKLEHKKQKYPAHQGKLFCHHICKFELDVMLRTILS